MSTIYGSGHYVGGTSGVDVLVANDSGQHLDGGRGNDNLNGGDGNDILQGGRGSDYMYGGAGDDTFLWLAGEVQSTDVDKVFDFSGAGETGGDKLQFQGMGAGSSLTLVGHYAGPSAVPGSVIYAYELHVGSTDTTQTIYVTSLNGKALTTDDYVFYG